MTSTLRFQCCTGAPLAAPGKSCKDIPNTSNFDLGEIDIGYQGLSFVPQPKKSCNPAQNIDKNNNRLHLVYIKVSYGYHLMHADT